MAQHRIPVASLPEGSVGRAGPWTVANRGGEVQGPRGFLFYVGRTPGYTQAIQVVGRVLPLRRRAVGPDEDTLVVE